MEVNIIMAVIINNTASAQGINTPVALAQAPISISSGVTQDASALAINKVVQVAPTTIGDPVQYAIVVQNIGTNTAIGVVMSDNAPSHVLFSNATTSTGTIVTLTNFDVSVVIGDMAPGAIATITITGIYAY